jgi:hypothetical protein
MLLFYSRNKIRKIAKCLYDYISLYKIANYAFKVSLNDNSEELKAESKGKKQITDN